MRAVVITCSDSAAAGTAPDTSGPLAGELLAGLGHAVEDVVVVADDVASIGAAVRAAADGEVIYTCNDMRVGLFGATTSAAETPAE